MAVVQGVMRCWEANLSRKRLTRLMMTVGRNGSGWGAEWHLVRMRQAKERLPWYLLRPQAVEPSVPRQVPRQC